MILINGLVIFVVGLVVRRQTCNGNHFTDEFRAYFTSLLDRQGLKQFFGGSLGSQRESRVSWLYYTTFGMQGVLTSKVIMINRLLRDDPSKGRTGTKTHTSMRDIWNTLKDPGEYPKRHGESWCSLFYRTDWLLVLCHDHLHTKKSGFSIRCTQPETTRFLKIRKQRINHAIRLSPRHHSAHSYTKQWPL